MDRLASTPATCERTSLAWAKAGVLLVDPDDEMRALVREVLVHHQFAVVGEAADGPGAVTEAAALRPGVVVLDRRLPGRDVLWTTRQIIARGLGARVVWVTTEEPKTIREAATEAGAFAIVLRGDGPGLVAAVREALTREPVK